MFDQSALIQAIISNDKLAPEQYLINANFDITAGRRVFFTNTPTSKRRD
jgi:hypothetical protein